MARAGTESVCINNWPLRRCKLIKRMPEMMCPTVVFHIFYRATQKGVPFQMGNELGVCMLYVNILQTSGEGMA
jgi:hypothetical protein